MTTSTPDCTATVDPALDELYGDIVNRHAGRILSAAASSVDGGNGLDEPGMLRIVLARLLLHERNAGQLAARAATLANAMSRLIAAQRRDANPEDDDLNAVLEELAREREAAARAAHEGATA